MYEPLRLAITRGVGKCAEKGVKIQPFETWRSPDRQNTLYDKGRSTPGKIVTKTKPWHSRHNYGLACDVAFRVRGQWSWEGDIEVVQNVMLMQGLESISWDCLHFQWPTYMKTDIMYAIAKRHGILAVWAKLNLLQKN